MRVPKLTGRDNLIKTKLEEGYSFTLLSTELGVTCRTLIRYVKGLDTRNRKKHAGISFRKPSTPMDLAERYDIPIKTVADWLRRGCIKGRKVGALLNFFLMRGLILS
jgi:hypothetical protein